MIRTTIDIIKYAKQYPGTASQKWSIFKILTHLRIKGNSLPSPSEPVSINIFKHKIFGYDFQALDFLFKEVYIAKDYNFVSTKESPVIIDCGSNIGMSVSYFKSLYPKSKIIAFEANPDAHYLLKKNCDENGFVNTQINNVALADFDGHISFFISEYKGTLTGSVLPSRGGTKELKITAVKLSDYIKDLDQIDLVKMDVEGAEMPIIRDSHQTGSLSKINELIVEYHHNMPNEESSLSEFLQIFESSGFDYSIRTNFFDLKAFQNILIHFYRK